MFKSGKMVANTSATGNKIKPMARVDLYTLMVMSTTESGKMIRLTVMESTAILTELSMKVSGRPVSDMDRAAILLLEGMFMSENTPGEKLKGMVSTLGKTEIYIPDSFSTDRKMAREAGRKVGMPTQIHTKATTS